MFDSLNVNNLLWCDLSFREFLCWDLVLGTEMQIVLKVDCLTFPVQCSVSAFQWPDPSSVCVFYSASNI